MFLDGRGELVAHWDSDHDVKSIRFVTVGAHDHPNEVLIRMVRLADKFGKQEFFSVVVGRFCLPRYINI